jgi:hypothetical protein
MECKKQDKIEWFKQDRQASSTESVKVIGVLADESASRTLKVAANQEMGDAVSHVSQELSKHLNHVYSLPGDGIVIDTDSVIIPGKK